MNHPNRAKLYTVLNRHGHVEERGCTVAQAAQVVMAYDGHSFEIRAAEAGHGFYLWTSQFSRNSAAGGRPLTKSVIFSLAADRASAEAEIYKQVIVNADWWMGCDVRSDQDYDAMLAEFARENEAE
jgi:hypothetical protein